MPMNMAGRIAKYLAISLAMENVVSAPRVMSSCLPMATTSMSLVGLLSRSTILPASLAAMVPVFIASPTSAWASAGASLVPSPVMATSRPPACSFLIRSILSLGVACARKSSTPASAAMEAAGSGVSPAIMDERGDAIGGAFAPASSVYIDAAHAGLRGEGDEVGLVRCHFAAAEVVLFLGQDHDGAALRGFVGQTGKLRRVGQLLFAHARQGKELHCLAVAEGDGAGLVQQQGVDVAGRLYRLAAHSQHVVLHDAIHAGDADGREQAADGGGDQADQ